VGYKKLGLSAISKNMYIITIKLTSRELNSSQRNLHQSLHKYFPQSGHELIRFQGQDHGRINCSSSTSIQLILVFVKLFHAYNFNKKKYPPTKNQ